MEYSKTFHLYLLNLVWENDTFGRFLEKNTWKMHKKFAEVDHFHKLKTNIKTRNLPEVGHMYEN